MTTDAPAPPGFVCLQCWRVWTADGQPETNPWELARAGIEIRFSAIQGPTTGPDGHCDVCDDGKKGPEMQPSSMKQRMRDALLKEIIRQHNDDSLASPFTVHDRYGNSSPLDFEGLAEAAVAAIGGPP